MNDANIDFGKVHATGAAKLSVSVIEPAGGLYGSEFALLDLLGQLAGRHRWQVILPKGAPLLGRLAGMQVVSRQWLPRVGNKGRHHRLAAYVFLFFRWLLRRPDLVYVNQAGMLRPIDWICRWLRIPVVCQVQTLEDADWVSKALGECRSVRSFVCNSRFIAERLKVESGRKSIFYQGYQWKGLAGGKFDRGSGRFVVGLLGRIGASKGHYLLVGAARLLADENLLQGWCFTMIGRAKTPAEDLRFREAVVAAGLEEFFEFRGYRENIADELRRVNLLVVPSLAEPLGRILFEGAEAELPMVCSDAGGLGEVSRYFDVGKRFASGDARNLADALVEVRNWGGNEYRGQLARYREMLSALDLAEYADMMERLLCDAASGADVAIDWYGNEMKAKSNDR